MKKIIISILLLFALVSCNDRNPEDFHVIGDEVDGYEIYEYEHKGLFCNTLYQIVYYSGETYNYGFTFEGCSPAVTFFILKDGDFLGLQEAINLGVISVESLLPQLEQLDRDPEIISSDEADYYWSDFHINGNVVYVYAGGECDQQGSETFTIDGVEYVYTASGCLQDHILYMQVEGEYIPVYDLLMSGQIDGEYLIPLLTENPN